MKYICMCLEAFNNQILKVNKIKFNGISDNSDIYNINIFEGILSAYSMHFWSC